MNTIQWKNNLYKNGEYAPDHSKAMAVEKAKDISPSCKQAEYRDALYKFCKEKGLILHDFKFRRTKQGISANIQALISILRKNGLAEEFFARNAKQPVEEGADHE